VFEDNSQRDNEVSLFLNYDWRDFLFDQAYTVFSEKEPWIEFVVHGPSIRAVNELHKPLLTPHSLIHSSAVSDQQVYKENETIPISDHKIGGQPCLINPDSGFVDAIQEAKRLEYRHLFQLDFPGSLDADIGGDWPFADGLFNFFVKRNQGRYCWRYCWQV